MQSKGHIPSPGVNNTHFPLSGRPGTVDGLGFHSVSEGNELKVKEHRVRMLAKKCQEIWCILFIVSML